MSDKATELERTIFYYTKREPLKDYLDYLLANEKKKSKYIIEHPSLRSSK